jgi:hypothetical protein
MTLVTSRIVIAGGAFAALLMLSVGPALAGGLPAPAPLVGVTGPVGIVAAGVAYGGYWLFQRYRNRG